jgi:hypothetical protein
LAWDLITQACLARERNGSSPFARSMPVSVTQSADGLAEKGHVVNVKTFFVRSGFLAFTGELWYEPGILVVLEPHERVDLFVARNGRPAACVGSYGYDRLDMSAPPHGLACHLPDTMRHAATRRRTAA